MVSFIPRNGKGGKPITRCMTGSFSAAVAFSPGGFPIICMRQKCTHEKCLRPLGPSADNDASSSGKTKSSFSECGTRKLNTILHKDTVELV